LLILSFVLSTFSLPLVSAAEDSWETMEPMPTARSSFGVAVVNRRIYAIGGTNDSLLGTNEMYDPVTDTWTTKKPMPTPRSAFAIAVFQNKIYVIGGYVGDFDYTTTNQVYDTLTDTGETKSRIPYGARAGFCANVVNGKSYLMGGALSALPPYPVSDETLVYDPANDSWTKKTSMPTPVYKYVSAVIDNKIYLIGGRSYGTIHNLTQIYDIETDTWIQGKTIPTAVYYAGALLYFSL